MANGQPVAWLLPILQVAAQAQQLRNKPTWAHAAQMAGLQVPVGMANIPIESQPHELIPALALAAQRTAAAQQTQALTGPRAQVYQAQAQAYQALGRQRETAAGVNVAREQQIQTDIQRALQFLDVEYQTALANLERARQQAETERARTGYITAQTQTLLNESEAEVQRIQAARDAMQALANLRGVQAAATEALVPYEQAALAGLAFQREAAGQRSLAAAEQTQALTPYLIQKAQQEARLVGARADQVERLTPVLVEVQQANAQAAQALAAQRQAAADLATAKAQTEIMMRPILVRQEELVVQRYAEEIRRVIADTSLTEAQRQQVLVRIEDDRQKTLAYLRLQEAKLGTELALQAYHQARTGMVETDTERLREQLPLELQILASRADAAAAEVALLQQRAETERARTGQVSQETQIRLQKAEAELREIESRILVNAERAELYRRQGGLLQTQLGTEQLRQELLRGTMPAQIRRAEAEAREAEAQADVAEIRRDLAKLDLDAATMGEVEDLTKHPAIQQYWKLLDTWRQMAGKDRLSTWEVMLLPREARDAYLEEVQQGVPTFMEWLRTNHPESLPIVLDAIARLESVTARRQAAPEQASAPRPSVQGQPPATPEAPTTPQSALQWPPDVQIARPEWQPHILQLVQEAGGAMRALAGLRGAPDANVQALARLFGENLTTPEQIAQFRAALDALLQALAERGM